MRTGVKPTRPRPAAARIARHARRPGHETSSAHLRGALPFLAGDPPLRRGIYIGRDAYGQAFCCDPFELYEAGLITSPNMAVIGQIGVRKSSLVKSILWRSRLFGRFAWVIDVKAEYGPLCEAIGGTTVALRPGGSVRLNPLSPHAGPEQQDELLQAVAAAALGRELEPQEATGLTAALDVVRERAPGPEPVLPDVAEVLLRPTEEMAARLVTDVGRLSADVRTVALALVRLTDGELRGMFDGPTSATIDWTAPLIVIDLAEVANSRALVVLMACATAAIQAQVINRHRGAELAQLPTPKTFGVVEEGWRITSHEPIARMLQSRYKLTRRYGESNIGVFHRVTDLDAAGDAGSTAVRLAEGLLAETEIRVTHKQPSDQIAAARRRMGFTETEAQLLPLLDSGVAIWHVGRHRSIVQHRISALERTLVETDQHMHLHRRKG